MTDQKFPQAVVYSAVTTPFKDDGGVDLAAFRASMAWLREEGLDGAIVCGTTGEFVAMTDEERMGLFKVSLEIFGTQGTIAHIGAATLGQALPILDQALALGVTRFAAITPYYQPGEPQSVHEYYLRLAERAQAGDGELLAYLFHARSATTVTPEQFGTIARDAHLAGAKVSGESTQTVMQYKVVFSQGEVVSGNDAELCNFIVAGGDGGVSGISQAFPKPFVAVRDALRNGDFAAARKAQTVANHCIDVLYGGSPRFLKAALDLRGLRGGGTRTALDAPTQEQLDGIKAEIDSLG